MALKEDLQNEVAKIFRSTWSTRAGRVVPAPEDIALSNDAVMLNKAAVLYADISGSTELVTSRSWELAAEVYKTFLFCAAKLVREQGGTITSYDGDRIMGVFVGPTPCSHAAVCALKLNWVVKNIINPALKAQYPQQTYTVKHVAGIDASPLRAARTGVRGGNDIVWVGRAANYAAKLTEIDQDESSWITKDVYDVLKDDAKYGGNPRQNIWKSCTWTKNGNLPIYGSTWWWAV